jgi:hypothetical protein
LSGNVGRSSLIDRIIEEKGDSAIPDMLAIMVRFADDPEVCEMVMEYLLKMGRKTLGPIRFMLNEFSLSQTWKDPDSEEIIEGDERLRKLPMFYLSEILGELGEPRDVPLLYKLLGLLNEEAEQLFLYEALARLGAGEELIDLLGFFVQEDENRAKLLDHAVMILSYIDHERSFRLLADALFHEWLEQNHRELVIRAIRNFLQLFPQQFQQLALHSKKDRIIELMEHQQKEDEEG